MDVLYIVKAWYIELVESAIRNPKRKSCEDRWRAIPCSRSIVRSLISPMKIFEMKANTQKTYDYENAMPCYATAKSTLSQLHPLHFRSPHSQEAKRNTNHNHRTPRSPTHNYTIHSSIRLRRRTRRTRRCTARCSTTRTSATLRQVYVAIPTQSKW